MGIKGVRYSHSGTGGGGVRRLACCDIHTTHFGGTAASEGMMQVDTTPIVPRTLSEKHLCDNRNTATQLEHKLSYVHTISLRQLMMQFHAHMEINIVGFSKSDKVCLDLFSRERQVVVRLLTAQEIGLLTFVCDAVQNQHDFIGEKKRNCQNDYYNVIALLLELLRWDLNQRFLRPIVVCLRSLTKQCDVRQFTSTTTTCRVVCRHLFCPCQIERRTKMTAKQLICPVGA